MGSIRGGIIKVVTHLVSKVVNTHKEITGGSTAGGLCYLPRKKWESSPILPRETFTRENSNAGQAIPPFSLQSTNIAPQARQCLNSPVAALRSGIHCGLVEKPFGGREAEGSRAAAPRPRRNGVRARGAIGTGTWLGVVPFMAHFCCCGDEHQVRVCRRHDRREIYLAI